MLSIKLKVTDLVRENIFGALKSPLSLLSLVIPFNYFSSLLTVSFNSFIKPHSTKKGYSEPLPADRFPFLCAKWNKETSKKIIMAKKLNLNGVAKYYSIKEGQPWYIPEALMGQEGWRLHRVWLHKVTCWATVEYFVHNETLLGLVAVSFSGF